MSTLAPYKGLANTADTPHVGTDPVTRHDAPTGGIQQGSSNYAKVRRPANPDYYTPGTPNAVEYVQNPENNGQYVNNPSKQWFPHGTDVPITAVYNQATNYKSFMHGYDPTARYAGASAQSNYGTPDAIAKHYNTGIHVVDSSRTGLAGAGMGAPLTGTRYSVAAGVAADY